jgi:NAD(P)-dependent dehydrogenase (short-subunit alcohol dehydrogenase family)
MPDSSSKIIVITGVTRGLGRALTSRFIESGHTVIGCGRNDQQIVDLQRHYRTPHSFSIVDVRADDQVAAWARRMIREHGAPDLLINNAAMINQNAPLWHIAADEFQEVIDVNIVGVVNCIRHFVPAMVERGTGVIVNLSSGWGRSTAAEVAPYCASKWAIEGLTQSLAQELPADMAAIPLNPGIINTEMLQSCFGHSAHHYPNAEEWSRTAAPYILQLGPRNNGESLSIGDG